MFKFSKGEALCEHESPDFVACSLCACVVSYVCSHMRVLMLRVLSPAPSPAHMCPALMCLLTYVCSHTRMYALIWALSFAGSHMLSPVCFYVCVCALTLVISYVYPVYSHVCVLSS